MNIKNRTVEIVETIFRLTQECRLLLAKLDKYPPNIIRSNTINSICKIADIIKRPTTSLGTANEEYEGNIAVIPPDVSKDLLK